MAMQASSRMEKHVRVRGCHDGEDRRDKVVVMVVREIEAKLNVFEC